jgi:hypothetical protein
MEPNMISFKILSTVAVLALVVAVPAASFAAPHGGRGGGGGGGGGARAGGAFHGGGGGSFHAGGGAAAFRGGVPGARFSGGGPGFRGGYHRHGGVFIPGSVVGAVGFYDDGYYSDDYYEDAPVAVVPAPVQGGDDSVGYCLQTYRSYDPRSGTYVGFDGLRHPCP